MLMLQTDYYGSLQLLKIAYFFSNYHIVSAWCFCMV